MRKVKETITPAKPPRELLCSDLGHMAKVNPTGEGEHFIVRELLRQHTAATPTTGA